MIKKIVQMLAILRSSLQLDMFDMTYEYSNEKFAQLNFNDDMLPRKGLLTRMASYLFWLSKYAVRAMRHRGTSVPAGTVIFFASAKNEYDSLSPVFHQMQDPHFIGPWGRAKNNLNMFLVYVTGILFLPLVLLRLYQSTGYRRHSFSYIFDQYLIGYGTYCVARVWFKCWQPTLLIVSNHLSATNRALLKAARDESITTLYIQHASIPENCPRLDTDYALLEGMDALSKFDALGKAKVKLFLVGMPKHDKYKYLINTNEVVKTIGLCINGLDATEKVEELCGYIARTFSSMRVMVRPHPADRRGEQWASMAKQLGFLFSDWKEETAFDFLSKVDANIAGDSNIHLEAVLLNVVPLYYNFDGKMLDYYGFLRNGLVEHAGNPSLAAKWLQDLLKLDKPQCRERAKSYCATVGTEWDWRSAELAYSVIEQIKDGGSVKINGWLRIPGIDLEAYEPALALRAASP